MGIVAFEALSVEGSAHPEGLVQIGLFILSLPFALFISYAAIAHPRWNRRLTRRDEKASLLNAA